MELKMDLFIFFIFFSAHILSLCLGSESEHLLVYDLLKGPGYNPLIRPVENITKAITVDFGLTLFQVISVEERTQVMKTNNWIRMTWNDYQLSWIPEKYGGIESIRLPCEEVWRPDVVLLNNADGKYEQSYCSNVVLYSDGTILFIPPSIYKSSCTIDVRFFPFDEQICEMVFGSWTFTAEQVQLALPDRKNCDLSNYVFSGTWDLMGCPANVVEHGKKYSEIRYRMILRRKTLFFTMNLLTPCVLISFLSVLTFYLPADAQEKVTLCISILLALVVFLLLVSKSLPPTSVTIPLISKYLFFTFMMNIATVIISVAIININFRSPRTYRMARWIRVIFLNWLPIIMFMQRPDHTEKYMKWAERKRIAKEREFGKSKSNGDVIEMAELRRDQPPEQKFGRNHNTTPLSGKALQAIESIEFITQHLRTVDDYDEVCSDWRFVATVVDRFLLFVFLIITISGTISIIVDAPYIFEVVDQQEIVDALQKGAR